MKGHAERRAGNAAAPSRVAESAAGPEDPDAAGSDSPVNGLLVDLGGTVEVEGEPLSGALEAIGLLRRRGKRLLFLSNTTTEPRDALRERLSSRGLAVQSDELLTPAAAASRLLAARPGATCLLLVRDEIRDEFAGLPESEDHPDYLVVGDIGNRWSYDLMDRLFHLVMGGAKIVALHKGRFWETARGLALDIGAFVAGLEYAAGVVAEVVGKPSRAYFEQAIAAAALPVEELRIVGDDIDSDIGGAQAIGLRGVLVRTGKYREEYARRSTVTPWREIDSFADLPALLGEG